MNVDHLHKLWSASDNSRLTTKQLSFRMPVHIAAKIAALCEIYPQKNRTQIVADLLAAALEATEESLPTALGTPVDAAHNDAIADQIGRSGEKLYYVGGVKGRFREVANRHYAALEAELGNSAPRPLYGDDVLTEAALVSK